MAFLATLGALTDELVTLITSTSTHSEPESFNLYRETALRNIRHHGFLRTNQFQVDEELEGLVERFSVIGRDRLSTALSERLRSLAPVSTKWTPDILHFLLELSDQPAQNSRLSDLDHLRQPDDTPAPQLKWEDIAREDGWADDKDLWRDIEYEDGSDDDAYGDAQSDVSSDSAGTSLSSSGASLQRTAGDLMIPADEDDQALLFEEIQKAQEWRWAPPHKDAHGRILKTPLSEAQVVREVLFMLHGLQSTLFNSDCRPVGNYQLAHVSWETYKALIMACAEIGRKLLPLRDFLQSKLEVPLLQIFQDCIRQSLRDFDCRIVMIEQRFIDLKADVIVSLVSILQELKPLLAPLYSLSAIIEQLREEHHTQSFRYLELLFDKVCMAQLEGNMSTYKFLRAIFFKCFQVYIRPIRLWMEEGQLVPGDKTFFVSESTKVSMNEIWQKQFKLRRIKDGTLHAPNFLQPAVKRIFNTGKSVVILRHLGRHQNSKEQWVMANNGASLDRSVFGDEPLLEFDSVCGDGQELATFTELFNGKFDLWIKSKYHTTSSSLQSILFESCGLWSSLEALQHLYFMSDASASDSFISATFENLDAMNSTWHDRFTLTELAQEAWSSLLDGYRLSATVDADFSEINPIAARSSVRNSLPQIMVHYRLAWPVQIIITRESIAGYQALFTLLLQVRRAAYVLRSSRILSDYTSAADGNEEQAAYFGIRTKLLWFCNAFHTYIANLVLMPRVTRMRKDLEEALDVDAMIEAHSGFISNIINEACLSKKLDPIRHCILDVLDLSIKLEDARRANHIRGTELSQKTSQLTVDSSPLKTPRRPTTIRRDVYVSPKDREEGEVSMFADQKDVSLIETTEQSYAEVLSSIRSDFDRHLRFITGGLRGVARASSKTASGKWDMLAEMLEMSIQNRR